jgi:hypothetical protein
LAAVTLGPVTSSTCCVAALLTRVRDALFWRLAERFRVQLRAAFCLRLVLFDLDPVRVGISVLADARHLP